MNARKTIKSFVIGCGLFLLGAVHADTLTVTSGQTVTIDSAQTYDAVSMSGGTIVLSAGGVLTTAGGVSVDTADSTICFDGGRLVTSATIAATGATLTLAGRDGDVCVDFAASNWINGFATGSNGKIEVTGAQKFVMSQKAAMAIDAGSASLSLKQTGRTEIHGATLYAYKDRFPSAGELFIAGESALNIGGMWITVGSLTGPGQVLGKTGGQVTVAVDGGKVGCCYSKIDPSLLLIKSGNGIVKVIGTTPNAFTVNAGTVRSVPRAELGYSQFRIKVDGAGGPSTQTGFALNELAYFVGDTDVTAQHTASAFKTDAGWNGGTIFDGKDSTKWWYEYKPQENPSFENAWVDVTFPERVRVTGYKLKSPSWGGNWPTSWRIYGRDPGGEWELLDQRVEEPTAPEPELKWSPLYALDCGTNPGLLTVPAITLAKGTALGSVADTKIVCANLVDNGATYDFTTGSSVILNVASDLTADNAVGGSFVKAGNGTLESYGAPTLDSLRVSGGTLALRTPVAFKQWKLAIGDVYNISGGEVTFGELAVYDVAGNRLNVNGSPTMASYDAGSFSGTQAKYLYDNDDTTQGWINSSGLVPSNESTWKTTLFTLTDSAPAVASYNLETASYGSPANGTPKTWKLYARASASDAWTLVDAQTDVATPLSSYTWYHGGVPWRLAATAGSVAAFSAATPVTVDAGATLDVSCAAETVIGHLVVDGDGEGVGVIRRGICADAGTLAVTYVGAVPKGSFSLPLKFEDVANADALANWTVTINGKVSRKKLAVDGDGQLGLTAPGMLLLFR